MYELFLVADDPAVDIAVADGGRVGFALAPESFTLAELRDVYEAALGYDVSATNLKRVLLRRGAIEAVGKRRAHGPAGGRPAELYRFRARELEVTDPFAVFRPPDDLT